ncbi:MAG TPA: hypothetical protein VGD73_11940 [Pseudonocardia sp.]|uniref:hypothetical protein n=1 Tax=Pseudonocardia sp. TaxID=60912 RepID=UPI002EDA793A
MRSARALGGSLNYDFARHDLDDQVTDAMIEASSGIRGLFEGVRSHLGRDEVTLRDLAAHRATLQGPRFVGTGRAGGRRAPRPAPPMTLEWRLVP